MSMERNHEARDAGIPEMNFDVHSQKVLSEDVVLTVKMRTQNEIGKAVDHIVDLTIERDDYALLSGIASEIGSEDVGETLVAVTLFNKSNGFNTTFREIHDNSFLFREYLANTLESDENRDSLLD